KQRLASAGNDGQIRIWRPPFQQFGGNAPLELKGNEGRGIYAIAFTPDGRRLVSCGDDSRIRVWDTTTGLELLARPLPKGARALAVSPKGNRLAVASGRDILILGEGE